MSTQKTQFVKQSFGNVKIGELREIYGAYGKNRSHFVDLLHAIHTWFWAGQVGAGSELRSTISAVYEASLLRYVYASVVTNQTCSDRQLEILVGVPTDKALELTRQLVQALETPNGLTLSTLQLLVRMSDSLHISPIVPGYPDRLRLYHLADVIRRSEAIPAFGFDDRANVWTEIGIDHRETIYEMTPASMVEREPSISHASSIENGIELRLPRPGEPFIIGASQGARVADAQWVTRLKGVLFLTDQRLILHPADGWAQIVIPLAHIRSCRVFNAGVRLETFSDAEAIVFSRMDTVTIETLALMITYLIKQGGESRARDATIDFVEDEAPTQSESLAGGSDSPTQQN